jgi:hypothetical protein
MPAGCQVSMRDQDHLGAPFIHAESKFTAIEIVLMILLNRPIVSLFVDEFLRGRRGFETSVLRHVPWNRVLLRREINSLAGRRTGNTSQSLLMTRLLAVRAGAPTPIFRNQKLNPMWV